MNAFLFHLTVHHNKLFHIYLYGDMILSFMRNIFNVSKKILSLTFIVRHNHFQERTSTSNKNAQLVEEQAVIWEFF